SIEVLANFRQLTIYLKCILQLNVAQQIATNDIELRIISPLAGIADLVADRCQLEQRLLLGVGRHPVEALDILLECSLDGIHHFQHSRFLSRRKFLGDVGLAQSFSELLVGKAYAPLPTSLQFFCPTEVLAIEVEVFLYEGLRQYFGELVNQVPAEVSLPVL